MPTQRARSFHLPPFEPVDDPQRPPLPPAPDDAPPPLPEGDPPPHTPPQRFARAGAHGHAACR